MGLLDDREPELWEKMQPYSFVVRYQLKLLSLRHKKTTTALPKYNFPMFQNHMLSQQGMAGSAKVVALMAMLYLPALFLYTWNAKQHQYFQE